MKKLALGALCVGLTIATACGGYSKNNDTGTDVTLPDSGDGTGVDAPPVGSCDPIAQTGCGAADRCTWIWDALDNPDTTPVEPQVGHLGCAPTSTGTVAVNGTCVRSGPSSSMVEGTGASVADNCSKGSYCLGTTCKAICSTTTAGACGADAACNRYSGIFVSMGMTVAGVCDLKCNPLTQRTTGAAPLEACNSMNPADPNVGCYTTAGTSDIGVGFSCARVPMPSKGLIDRSVAYGPADGGAYSNGCDAGYLPAWADNDDPTITKCAGFCAPADSDNSTPATIAAAVGDPTALAKLRDVATPRVGDGLCTAAKKGSAGGAEDCKYLWPSNVDMTTGMLTPSPYNDTVGFCFPYTDYTYDNDNNPATPEIGNPSCRDLPPAGGNAMSTVHGITADQLDCYNSVRTAALPPPMMPKHGVTAHKVPRVHAVMTLPGAVAYRHILL